MPYLYLVRHGTALSADVNPQKPLSHEGRAEVERIGKKMSSRHYVKLDKIFHSEKARAAETAEILQKELSKACPCIKRPGLAPNDDPKALIQELELLQENWMIVSHLPYLDRLLSLLVTGSDQYRCIHFDPGTAICLTRQPNWLIEWMESRS